ncbi:MAG: hypothetical protein ABL949_06725 [Fimbriimonadaceae bacterium]
MHRLSAVVLGFLCGATCLAQVPDVKIKLDLRIMNRSVRGEDSATKFYDWQGKHSLAMLEFRLEPGYRVFISERFQKILGDADDEQLDEYFVEDPGLWRVGKQTAPFGLGRLYGDKVRGARGDTNILIGTMPIAGIVFDNGSKLARGVIVRFGERIGFSAAIGNNLAAQASSQTPIRKPEDGPGQGRGHQVAFGAHLKKSWAGALLEVEGLALRRGQTPLDQDADITDLLLTLRSDPQRTVGLGWSRDWRTSGNFVRFVGHFQVHKNGAIEPMIRLRNGAVSDASVTLNIKF